jgi:hypothetical protein
MRVICTTAVRQPAKAVQQCALFRSWVERFKKTSAVGTVTIYATYAWGGEIRMIQMGVEFNGEEQAVYLRGGTVDMLTVVTDGSTRCVVHVDQPRVAVGQKVRSNPSGMVDGGESRAAAALREVAEEVGDHINWGPVTSMHPTLFGTDAPLLVSPGGTDEEVTFFFVEGHMSTAGLQQLSRRIGGLAHEGEQLRMRLTTMVGSDIAPGLRALVLPPPAKPDMKAAMSLLMYQQYLARTR